MKYFITNAKEQFKEHRADMQQHPEAEMTLVKVYTQIEKQKILGFGGAFTEASAYVFHKMSEEKKEEFLELYFGQTGNRYQLGRLHIQSCDFALGNRAYVEDGDASLDTFSIEKDFTYQIPLIKAALKKNSQIQFLASPWSPPAFMKSNKEMNHGGYLLEEWYTAWAKIMVKYLLAYKEEGIVIDRVTVQNEPAAIQKWDSCLYTGKQEGIFAANYLRRELDFAGLLHVGIFIWDHNKDRIIERCEETFAVDGALEAVSGIAYHWYSGDHFEALHYVQCKYPDKEFLFTEGCVEYSRFADTDQTAKAEMYAHSMIGDIQAGMHGFFDWNLLLDEQGGPNHVENFCDAPVMYDSSKDFLDVKLSYYYIGHFSRFIMPGASRVLASSYNKDLECAAFVNPDSSKVVVILNTSDADLQFELGLEEKGVKMNLPAHSIMTAVQEA